ncbi:hypothetical protein [Streptomyces sp. NPDC060002]|uniref:hypothetical protein n=1 Tax=Streptomyces sp. NPDC060002 TaxID=3347033 RepID=UPI00369DA198
MTLSAPCPALPALLPGVPRLRSSGGAKDEAPAARRPPHLLPLSGPTLLLLRVGAGGLVEVEGVAVGVVERGCQGLLALASQPPPHRRVRAVLRQLLRGGGKDGHGLAVVPGVGFVPARCQ